MSDEKDSVDVNKDSNSELSLKNEKTSFQRRYELVYFAQCYSGQNKS